MRDPIIPGESPAERRRRRMSERYYAKQEQLQAVSRANYYKNQEARQAAGRAWHHANKEKANAARMARYLADHEAGKAKLRESYQKHKAKRNAENKADYYANRDKYLVLRKANAAANPERERASHYRNHIRARLNVPYKKLLITAAARATKKKVPFSLTVEWAEKTWTGRCAVTGIEFKLGLLTSGPKMYSPSIDRIVPELGYVPGNCRFILWAVNAFKCGGTDEDMRVIAAAIIANFPAVSGS